MSNTQKLSLGCLTLAVIVLFGGGALALLLWVPDVAEQFPPGMSTIVVTLSTPVNDAQVPLNQFTTVTAEAMGASPITALELWIDGIPAETKTAPAGSNLRRLSAFWGWTPVSEGEHTLLVRATDANHGVGQSNVVRVTASSTIERNKPVETTLLPIDTLKTMPEELVTLLSQLEASDAITFSQAFSVPIQPPPSPTPAPTVSPTPTPPSGPVDPAPSGPPNKNIIWIKQNIFAKIAQMIPPAAPELAANVKAGACSANLYIYDKSGDEDGFFIYRLAPHMSHFKRIATLDAHTGALPIHYVDPGLYGKFQYYVASFNAFGESPSNYVTVNITESQCFIPQWQAIGLENGKVTVKKPVDKIYCYLSIDNGPWTRIPPVPNTFIYPKGGTFDVSPYIKTLTPSPPPPTFTLHLECWGWAGNTLIYLGEAQQMITSGSGNLKLNAADFDLAGEISIMKAMSGNPPPPSGNIAPPFNVHTTTDSKECLNHFTANWKQHSLIPYQTCGGTDNGYQFLVWDWLPPENAIKDINGYHVYKYDVGDPKPKLITTVEASVQMAVAILPKGQVGLVPTTFIVRAFKGTQESGDSNQTQMLSTGVKLTLTSNPGLLQINMMAVPSSIFKLGPREHNWSYYSDNGMLTVGMLHVFKDEPWPAPNFGRNFVFRGTVGFDTTWIKGHVKSAILKFKQDGGYVSGGGWNLYPSGCGLWLMADGVDFLPPWQVPWETGVDVTGPVSNWVNGAPNLGFTLRGDNEELKKYADNDACNIAWKDFELQVIYSPPP